MGWSLKTGRWGRSSVMYPGHWQTRNGELWPHVDGVPSHFTKQSWKGDYFWHSRWKACRSSQVSKGPGKGAGSGVSEKEEQNDVTLRARGGYCASFRPPRGQAGVKFPLHGNMAFYWETVPTSPGLTQQSRPRNKIMQAHENGLVCRNSQWRVSQWVSVNYLENSR